MEGSGKAARVWKGAGAPGLAGYRCPVGRGVGELSRFATLFWPQWLNYPTTQLKVCSALLPPRTRRWALSSHTLASLPHPPQPDSPPWRWPKDMESWTQKLEAWEAQRQLRMEAACAPGHHTPTWLPESPLARKGTGLHIHPVLALGCSLCSFSLFLLRLLCLVLFLSEIHSVYEFKANRTPRLCGQGPRNFPWAGRQVPGVSYGPGGAGERGAWWQLRAWSRAQPTAGWGWWSSWQPGASARPGSVSGDPGDGPAMTGCPSGGPAGLS
jgi:hypothetical protein